MTALCKQSLTHLSKGQTREYVFDSVNDFVNAHTSNECLAIIAENYKAAALDAGFTLHDDLLDMMRDYRNKLEMKLEVIHHLPTFTDREKELINTAARRANMGYLQYVRYAALKAASKF